MIDPNPDEFRAGLAACLAVPRWVDEVAAAAPFASQEEMLRVAGRAATPLSGEEIEQALAHHPRIGESPTGAGREQEFSRREQGSAADADDARLAQLIAEGNRAYEQRFGRVFLIRAAGRSRAEILTELNRRLQLDEDSEAATVAEQLREIALHRLAQLCPGEPS